MTKDEIKITDLQRILIGDVPVSFFIEAFIRLVIIYIILVSGMRLMGKRMASQMSRNELVAIVTLAAAIGIPIQSPDRGLIPAIIIAIIVVFMERWVSAHSFDHPKFEHLSQGDIALLVQNGVLQPKPMKATRICREKIAAYLRSQGIRQLGSVKLLYLEASGTFTMVKDSKEHPGLSILPDWDKGFNERQKKAQGLVCTNCGAQKEQQPICANCRGDEWVSPISG